MNIKELKELTKLNAPIKGTFVISKCELKPFNAKNGFFLQCLLTDLTGSIKGIIWDGAETIRKLVRNKMVVEVTGEITRYNDMPQVIVKTMVQKKDYNPEDFLPSISADKILIYAWELNEYGDNIKNEVCRKLWKAIVPEPKPNGGYKSRVSSQYDYLWKKFIQCPGGIGDVHHNYMGGLIEHVYGMIKTAETVSKYTGLDRDILMTGCLIHDIGKIESYSWEVILEMTDKGRLLHHTAIGYGILMNLTGLLVKNEFEEIPSFDNNETLLKLAHIIISHHEQEGIRKPMFPEAQAVSTLDAMDAAVQHAIMFANKPENQDPESNWTTFCRLTERQYFVPKKICEIIPEPEPKKDNVIKMESMF